MGGDMNLGLAADYSSKETDDGMCALCCVVFAFSDINILDAFRLVNMQEFLRRNVSCCPWPRNRSRCLIDVIACSVATPM